MKMFNNCLIITGASGMLGQELVKHFSKNKHFNVVSVDIAHSNSNENELYFQVDVSSERDVEIMFTKIDPLITKDSKLSLINCAGISVFEDFEKRTKDSFMRVIEVNLFGTFNMLKQTVEIIKSNNITGSIVNTGSIFAKRSPDERNYIDLNRKNSEVYGASKAGVEQMTRYFSAHLAKHNIRVNCVSPGGILNEEKPQGEKFQKLYNYKVPMGRMATYSEVVGAYDYFLDDEKSRYVTGQTLVIDGGYTAW